MNGAAVYHRATDSFCYAADGDTLHLRLRTAAGDVERVEVFAGDPHDWARAVVPAVAGTEAASWAWRNEALGARKVGTDGLSDFWQAEWRPPYRRARYFFRLHAVDGTVWDYGEKGLIPASSNPPPGQPSGDYWNAFVFPYINAVDVFRAPDWVAGTVWYQIFPERFANGDPSNDPAGAKPWSRGPVRNEERYGGDLRGVIRHLDRIAGLGFNGLYLTPIFAAPSAHKYDTTDYLRVDPAFGTEDELRELSDACRTRGIRLMLDAVFNHSGPEFGPWKDVLEKGEASRYRDWFHIKEFPLFPEGKDTGDSRRANFETFAFTTRMPKLNTANPGLKAYLLDAAERYVRDFGISGWRLDVANEIDHQFWREFRARVKAADPEAYIVGEIWHDAMPWLRGEQYDAVMNYPYGTAISDFLLGRPWARSGEQLGQRLAAIDFSYPEPVLRASFNPLDSHDTDRIVTRFGSPELARVALTLLFALPGAPCIYYGTEYALEGGQDPDNRRCLPVDPSADELGFQEFTRALVGLRREAWRLFAHGERKPASLATRPGFAGFRVEGEGRVMLALAQRDGEAVAAAEWRAAFGLEPSARVADPLGVLGADGGLPGRTAAILELLP
ncbi:MAG TPA: glycoside hydrolase family 13 protein [Spirochaetales bacterium]|nr:glycoside hydrolase family 13 protein [Spirochaetales bacterium]